MALIIPTAVSTYADATRTEGRFQKYVLAQFRSDADLEWVRRARSRIVKAELKYKDFKEHRPSLRKDKDLWSQIEKGAGQASIVVVDPGEYEPLARETLLKEDIERAGSAEKAIVDACAMEVLGGTPFAYLPMELHKSIGWFESEITSLAAFKPTDLAEVLGSKLKHAVIFAARAHAIFDVSLMDRAHRTSDAFISPRFARVILPEVLSTTRYFDNEFPLSVKILNRAVEVIAAAIEDTFPEFGDISGKPLVLETDSRGYDELQASDVAAGWAREMLEVAEPHLLGARFERVWLNGRRIK